MTVKPYRYRMVSVWRNVALLVASTVIVVGCSFVGDNDAESGPVDDGLVDAAIVDPTILIHSSNLDEHLGEAGLAAGPTHGDYTAELVDRSLVAAIDGGDDRPFMLRQALIPTLVTAALTSGAGDPAALSSTGWLGRLDGRLDAALTATGYTPAGEPPTEADVTAVVEPGLLQLAAISSGIGANRIDRTVIITAVDAVDRFAGTGGGDSQAAWASENGESLYVSAVVLATLHANERIAYPEGITSANGVIDADIRLDTIPVLDGNGEPLVIDGQSITAEDWAAEFGTFLFEAAKVEGAS